MREHPGVEVVGCYEPDAERQAFCAESGDWDDAVWFDSIDEILDNPEIVAVASEGANRESLAHTEAIIGAGKHCFYDKPAGDDFHRFMRVIEDARAQNLQVTLGYMFRKHDGFERMANWVRSGFLGHVFQVRAHMSTWLPERSQGGQFTDRQGLSYHRGGVLYDLGGHVLDQIVWMMGRPERVTSYLQNATSETRDFMDNTLAVLEYSNALVTVDIAAMEPRTDGTTFRGLRHGGISDHGAVRTRRPTPTVPHRTQRRLRRRRDDARTRGSKAIRRYLRRVRGDHPRRRYSATHARPRTSRAGDVDALHRRFAGMILNIKT